MEWQQGIIAGLLFGAGALVIARLPSYRFIAAAILLTLIAPLAISGFLFPPNALGISDWDYYLSYYHNTLKIIQDFHSFPVWNPYTCGGTAALGDPEFPVFSPLFALDLLFGESLGLRLSIFVSLIVGSWGVLALTKRLKFSVYAGLLACLGIFFGSVNLLESVEGHQNVLSTMWIPWLFWAYLGAYNSFAADPKLQRCLRCLLCGIFLTLIFFQGGIFLLTYTALALLILPLLTRRHLHAFIISIGSGVWAAGLAAVKLLPTLAWLQQFQKPGYASSVNTLPYLDKIFLGRYLHTYVEIIPQQGSAWHQYGAYIGPFIILLALLGLIIGWRKRLVVSLFISAALAIFLAASGPYLKPFFDHASFLPRSNVNRAIFYAVIPLSLLAGIGLDAIVARGKKFIWIALILLTATAVDLMSLLFPLSQQAFVVPQNVPAVSPAPSPIAFTTRDYKTRVDGVDYSRAYSATLAGYGTMNYCSVLTPPPAVRTIFDEGDNGILMVRSDEDKSRGTYTLEKWTPGKVTASVTSQTPGAAVLNTNFAKGWYVNNQPAISIDGRVGSYIPTGTSQVVFQYHPRAFIPGLVITLTSLLTVIALWVYNYTLGRKKPI